MRCAIYGSSYMKSHSETNTPRNSQQLLKYIRGLGQLRWTEFRVFFPLLFYIRKKVKVLSYPTPPFFCFLEGHQALPICLSGRSSMYMMMSVEHWWNDSGKKKLAYLEAKRKKKPVPVPLCPPQISGGPAWYWIRSPRKRPASNYLSHGMAPSNSKSH